MVIRNAIQDGPGAASGYPFTSKEAAEACSCLADLSISVRDSINGVQLALASATNQRLLLTDGNGAAIFNSDGFVSQVTRVKNFLLVQWNLPSMVVNATFDINGTDYIGTRLPLCDRVIYTQGDVLTELEVVTTDDNIFIDDKFSMRGGYNCELKSDASDLTVDVSAGLGDGQFEDCLDDINAVRSIGGAKPDEFGNVSFTGDDCIRVSPELVDTNNGYFVSPARFYLHDDCEACCRCEEKASVWRVAKDLQDKLIGLVGRYQKLREAYNNRVSDIRLGSDCNTRPLLHVDLIANIDNNLDLYVSVCNGTDKRIDALEIRLSPLILRSAQGAGDIVRRKLSTTPPEFFEENPGIIELPDYDDEFISLHEAIRRALPVNLSTVCERGYIYTVGKKKHIKMPGGINILQTPYNESGYRVTVDPLDSRRFDIKNDGGITIYFHCLEPGDTRYFTAQAEFFPASPDAMYGVKDIGPISPREIAVIAWSPNNSSINVVAKTGTGFGAECFGEEEEEDE
jgi:hypothetical protein